MGMKKEKYYVPENRGGFMESLFMEYIRHWYVLLITLLTCVPGFLMTAPIYTIFQLNAIKPFVSALLTMAVCGFVATLPMLILNILLVVRKKYYAIAVQICLFEFVGTLFFLVTQINLSMTAI